MRLVESGGTQLGERNLHKVSDLGMLQVNDHSNLSQFCDKLNKNWTPIPAKFISINSSDIVMVDGNYDSGKTQKNNGGKSVVIELEGGGFDKGNNDDDDDCVFVSKAMNFLPRGKNKKNPICVDEYAGQKKVPKLERIVSSDVEVKKTPKLEKKGSIDVDRVVHCVDDYDVDDDAEVRIIDVVPFFRKKKSDFTGISSVEVGESSGTKSRVNDCVTVEIDDNPEEEEPVFFCDICADSKPKKESFRIKGCSHSYCSECMKTYVASKLQEGVSQIGCPIPGCGGVLEPEYCREILPFDVFSRWGTLLCESVILASQKFYCPFKGCSALLIDDGDGNVTQAECPSSFRLFCAKCKVGWHAGIECSEYQKLNKDEREKEDLLLRNLAKSQKWQRCPVCKFYVERSEGCLYMKCRRCITSSLMSGAEYHSCCKSPLSHKSGRQVLFKCGVAFCYSCGDINKDHRYHYCKKCGR